MSLEMIPIIMHIHYHTKYTCIDNSTEDNADAILEVIITQV